MGTPNILESDLVANDGCFVEDKDVIVTAMRPRSYVSNADYNEIVYTPTSVIKKEDLHPAIKFKLEVKNEDMKAEEVVS